MSRFTTLGTPYDLGPIEREQRGSQRWYRCPNGEAYPSITTVLGHGDKPWLENWRNMLGDAKADREQKRCAQRGTAVHEMAEKYLMNDKNPTKGYKAEHARLFNQIKVRLNKINNIRAQELFMYSEQLRLAGTVDCIGEYDGTLSVIDFKTSNNNKDESMVQDYFLQCTAYAIMYFELFDEPIEDIAVVIAVEKGMMPMVYRRKIDDYVGPLLDRINTFYDDMKGRNT
jgi:genome maintenance exonuclease 1